MHQIVRYGRSRNCVFVYRHVVIVVVIVVRVVGIGIKGSRETMEREIVIMSGQAGRPNKVSMVMIMWKRGGRRPIGAVMEMENRSPC